VKNQPILLLFAALLTKNIYAQKVVIKLGIVEGAPCTMHSIEEF